MTQSQRHHYIPIFYLSKWAGSAGYVTCCQWVRGELVSLQLNPTLTGVQRHLYRLDHVPPDVRLAFEKFVTADVDSRASAVLRKITTDGVDELTPEERLTWAQFLVSLPIRNPEAVADIKKTSSAQAFENAYKLAAAQYPEWAQSFDLRKELREGIDEEALSLCVRGAQNVVAARQVRVRTNHEHSCIRCPR